VTNVIDEEKKILSLSIFSSAETDNIQACEFEQFDSVEKWNEAFQSISEDDAVKFLKGIK